MDNIDGTDYYLLTNYAELVWFSKQVSSRNASINACLVNNITANTNLLNADGSCNTANAVYEWTPAGSMLSGFQGIFDGNGKTIQGIYIDTNTTYVGLFGNIAESGVVKNLDIKDSYIKGSNYTGAVSGSCVSNSSVQNCSSSAVVIGGSYVGGIVGSSSANAVVSGCYTTGSVSGSGSNIGGIAGQSYYDTNVKDSCSVSSPAVGNKTIASVSTKTAKQFASGEVCIIINGGVTDGTQAWYQTLGTDSMPVLDSTHGTVYSKTYTDFDGTPFEGGTYSNKSLGNAEPETKTVDGVEYYIITSYPELVWFSKQVLEGETKINAMLGSDITANEKLLNGSGFNAANKKYLWTPVGSDSTNAFEGIFDGNGYTISGLYIEKTTAGTGLFGNVKGTVKNVSVKDTYISGKTSVGTIVGYALYGSVIENCSAESVITADNTSVGGIVGYLYGGTVSNCCSSGSVTAKNYAGGIVGFAYISSVSNSYSLCSTSCSGTNKGGVAGNASNSTFTACCSLEAPYIQALDGTLAKTAAEFASGEVCWLLNNKSGAGAWYQTLGSDAAPVLDSTHASVVYDGKAYSNVLLGDTNLNGRLEKVDAALLMKHINKACLTDAQLAASDINGDGKKDMLDVVGILKAV